MSKRKILALLLAVAMVCSLYVPALAAGDAGEPVAISDNVSPKFTDIDGHWAESAILRWADYGIVKGDGDGTANPGRSLRRAELATILARLLGLKETAPAGTFKDVPAGSWYAEAVLQCAKAGIMLGDGNGYASPEATIDRQQTIVMVARALGVKPASTDALKKFTDTKKVADWAAPFMAALTEMDILHGIPYDDGAHLDPVDAINRAATFALLDKAIAHYVTTPSTVNASDPNKFVVINAAAGEDVTVTGTAAGVVVAPGTTDDVVLDNATVDTLKVDAPVNVTIKRDSAVTDLDANAAADVTNDGTVTNLNTNADDVTFDGNKPEKVNTAEGVEPAKDSKGKEVTDKTETSTPSPSPSKPVVRADLVPAPLHDNAEADKAIADEDLGTVTVTNSKSGTTADGAAKYAVKVTGRGIMNHTNANSADRDGHWVGFGMPAKESEDGSTYTYEVDDVPVATIAQRTYTAPNGKTYNTVYFSNEKETFDPTTVTVMDGDEVKAVYEVTFDVQFYKADVTVSAELLDEADKPYFDQFTIKNIGQNMKAALKGTDITVTGEVDTAKLNKNTPDGPTEYTYYGFAVKDEKIKTISNSGLGENKDARALYSMAVKIYDTTAKELLKTSHVFELKDAAGRVQDTVTVTVDATGCSVQGMSKVVFKDGDTVLKSALSAGEAVAAPDTPAHTEKTYYTGAWLDKDGKVTETFTPADGATETVFTAQKFTVEAQDMGVRKDGPEGNNQPGVENFGYAEIYGKAGLSFDTATNTVKVDGKELAKYAAEENNQLNHLLGGDGKTLFVGLEYTAPAGATQYAWAGTLDDLKKDDLTALNADTQSTYGSALITYIAAAKCEDGVFTFLEDVEDNAENKLESTPYIMWAKDDGTIVKVTKATLSRATTVPTFTVTFDADGGSEVGTQSVEYGAKAQQPTAPTKTGYTLKGWLKGEEAFDFDNVITGDVTLKAEWEAVEYTVMLAETEVGKYTVEDEKVPLTAIQAAYTAPGWKLEGYYYAEAQEDGGEVYHEYYEDFPAEDLPGYADAENVVTFEALLRVVAEIVPLTDLSDFTTAGWAGVPVADAVQVSFDLADAEWNEAANSYVVSVTGQLKLVEGFTGFNSTVEHEQSGYYMAIEIKAPAGTTGIVTDEPVIGVLNEFAEVQGKTFALASDTDTIKMIVHIADKPAEGAEPVLGTNHILVHVHWAGLNGEDGNANPGYFSCILDLSEVTLLPAAENSDENA